MLSSRAAPAGIGRGSPRTPARATATSSRWSGADGITRQKADPFATYAEVPPANASVVYRSRYTWADEAWLERRRSGEPLDTALLCPTRFICGIVAAGAFLAGARGATRPVTSPIWGFTHVELMPVSKHPYPPFRGDTR